MKKKLGVLIVIAVIAGIVISMSGVSQAAPEKMVRKIVVFKSGVLNEQARDNLIERFGGVKIKNLDLIGGKAVLLPPSAEAALVNNNAVLRVDDDVEVYALERPVLNSIKPQQAEVLPWGIDRIDAEKVWGITTGDPVKVAIVDTGIDLKHPDLQANIKGGYNAINPRKTANDDNGHGTHVAGTVAALDNEAGVIGVGPKIDIYAVKVLNAAGSGYLSDVIEGLDWAVANGMQVVNMSLGTSTNVRSFYDAITRANQAGIVQVAAAGNNYGGLVDYPAAYPEVIAVSATDKNNTIAYFSSVGPEVDLAAPGVSIYSTYKGQTYKTLNGTSMASPHAAGTAALVIDVGKCGACTPSEVQQRLETTAQDLGVSGKDNLYGSGLVNAYNAVVQ